MLRIYFSSADLARTQVAEGPDPMWETVLSLHMLTASYGRLAFAEWRSRVRTDLRRHGLVNTVRMLSLIAPDGRYFPAFLTPPEGLLGVDAGIEKVVTTLHTRIRKELEILQKHAGAPSWAWELTESTSRARKALGAMLRDYHRRAVGPYWATIRERAAVDRAVRTRVQRTEGITALLDNFRPNMRWRSSVLEIDSLFDRDLHLQGRGLLLIPSHADLITSHRHGNSTLHVITRLGLALLRGAAHEARPPHGERPPSAQRPRHGR